MHTGRRSRRSSADSRLSAILKPLSTYEPLSPDALEQARVDATESQSRLPTWSSRPTPKSAKRLTVPVGHQQSQWSAMSAQNGALVLHSSHDRSYGAQKAQKPDHGMPTLSLGIDIDGDGLDTEDDISLLQQTPTHRQNRRSHRLSHQAIMSRNLQRKARARSPQPVSALPVLPTSISSSDSTGSEKLAPPPVPPKAANRYTISGQPIAPIDPNIVAWEGPNDPGNPMNWPKQKKWLCTVALGLVTFCVTFASSAFSAGTIPAARHYGTSDEVMVLGTALFVLGFSFGPIVWGPISELFGRKPPLTVGFVVFAIFQVPIAVADNLVTLFVCRFLAGFFGCAPLTIVGGALADFWDPISRGVAVSVFACATFLGPTMGPIIGGFLTENESLGFRWNSWITLILSGVFGLFFWFAYPESFGPVLLQRRAKKLRYSTRNWALRAPADEIEVDLKAIFSKYLSKPFAMLVMEPILLLITIYISFIYGILYLLFECYPFSFIEQRHWSLGMTGLPFIAVMVGVVLGGVINLLFTKLRFAKIMQKTGRLPPEERLLPMAFGGVSLPIGLFWFAWTSSPGSSPWPQMLAGAPAGMGIVLIFLQGLNYLIGKQLFRQGFIAELTSADVYLMHANSAIAGNTFVRSLFGAGFPMFATYMYKGLGVQWATTVLGFIALALMPVPLLFFIFGERIRKMSRFVPKLPLGPPGGLAMAAAPKSAPGSSPDDSPVTHSLPVVVSEKV